MVFIDLIIANHFLKIALTKIHFWGIFKIINISSKILLLLDKNFITVFDEPINILKNIPGIFSGYLSRTFKKILSRNLYFLPILKVLTLSILSIFFLIYLNYI